MKTLKVITLSAVLGLTALGLSGCTATQKGAAGGGLAGGIAGTAVGASTGAPVAGALLGAAGGATAGGFTAEVVQGMTDEDTRREMENLRAEVQAKEDELAALRSSAPSDEALAELDAAREEVDRLQAALEAARSEQEEFAISRSAMSTELEEKASVVTDLEQGLSIATTENVSLQSQIANLETQIAAMTADISAKEMENEQLASAIEQKSVEVEQLRTQVQDKQQRLDSLNGEVEILRTSLTGKEEQLESVGQELDQLNVKLEETTRGLTMTIVDSLLYMPGQAELSADGKVLIGNIAEIIHKNFEGREIMVEGHTDNVPIVHSGWRSNWELGAGRALTLLHELVNSQGIDPALVSAASYGEFRPSASNATPEGREKNRRAVIVILPEKMPVQRESLAQAD